VRPRQPEARRTPWLVRSSARPLVRSSAEFCPVLLVSTVVLSAAPALAQSTHHVAPGGTGNGENWTTPFGAVEQALANAQPDDSVWVKQGTYTPTTTFAGVGRERNFALKGGVRVLGGFPPAGSPEEEDRNGSLYLTTLSGLLVPADPAQSAFHVVTARAVGDEAILDGFVIRDGRADGDPGSEIPVERSEYGGGFLALPNQVESEVNEPRIQNCLFTENFAVFGGGAASSGLGGTGGGLVEPRPSFRACEFRGNDAESAGGGAATHRADIEFISCLIHENTAASGGGLASLRFSTLDVVGSTVVSNSCVNAVFGGGGILVQSSIFATLSMTSSIVVGNSDGDATATFFDQVRGGGGLGLSGLTIEYSCVTGIDTGIFPDDNIDDDPEFVDPSAGDYRLDIASPCIDAGNPVAGVVPADDSDVDGDLDKTEPTPDLSRRQRIQNVVLDMGAFERRCLGDLDFDGDVDSVDLALFIGQWGQTCWSCAADMNDDGFVDASDLPFLLGGWGSCEAQFPPPALAPMLMSESSSAAAGATPVDLAELLGFASVEACVAWLSTLPPVVVHELLEVVFGPMGDA
jgi:hypothetical protein